MPELPEVETIRMQLDRVLKGLRITSVEILTKKSFVGDERDLRELRVLGVKRRGKITIIELEGGVYLAIHLKLTGQLIFREAKMQSFKDAKKYCEQKDGPFAVCELPNKYTRVIINFDNGGKLYFNDLRIFGWMKIIQSSKSLLRGIPSEYKAQSQNLKLKSLDDELKLGKFGPEANNEKEFSLEYFQSILSKTKKPVKIVIMDQEKLAGVGNIYANEALFMAGILPARPANSLSEKEIKKLRNSVIKVLKEAIEHKGSSDRDEAYRQITGEKGTHQKYLQVYGQARQKCSKCGGIIKRITLGGRGTFYCENCQK